MLRIKNIKRSPKLGQDFYEKEIEKILGLKKGDYRWAIHQESLDARKKDNIFFLASINVWPKLPISPKRYGKNKNVEEIQEEIYSIPFIGPREHVQPIVVGAGPCGLFAAYILAQAGLKPILLERGKRVEERIRDVEDFWKGGPLDVNSNVQFGEGGAGTFSDGKLTSRSKDPRGRFVNETFVKFGAPDRIAYMKKPHIGTDRLRKVLVNLRKELLDLGCQIHFQEELLSWEEEDNFYRVKTNKGQYLASHLILALGHSARNTFEAIHGLGLKMEAKPFAVGFRIEQSQDMINNRQHGQIFKDFLPPAEYSLTHQAGEIGCYTFCMCPGGYVVAASSEEGRLVVNGMSYLDRGGANANAAILATVDESIFGPGLFSGMEFQRSIEEKAFALGGGDYKAPCQRAEDYLRGIVSPGQGDLVPSYKPGVKYVDLNQIYPEKINQALQEALKAMDKKIPGFASGQALLTGVETRSSSPVRIVRDLESLESISHPRIYPGGEGAGYAGGIVSSAIDGIRIAEKIIENMGK